jgi:flagellar biosynthetic protein FlhB
MAEDNGDKTEAPTQRRREEAREQGQIARSADLVAAALLLGLLLLMAGFGQRLIAALKVLMEHLLSADLLTSTSTGELTTGLASPLTAVAAALAPVLIGGILIGILANLIQVGFFLSPKRLQPNLETLNPVAGFARLCRADNFAHLAINLLKLGLVTALAWSAVHGRLNQIVTVQTQQPLQAFTLGASLVYAVGLRIAVLLLVLAILDYAWQKWRHEQQLRMTKQEVKEEMRRMEGDPKLKQRRRQLAIQMALKSLKKNVPTADVVITNPTHFAVALKYEQTTMHAPRVVAKGQDLMAQRIREIAVEHGIPVIERKPLARALYRLCEVGHEIPEQFYSAVAEILAYVYEISGKLRRKSA